MREVKVSVITAVVILCIKYLPKFAWWYRYHGLVKPLKLFLFTCVKWWPSIAKEIQEGQAKGKAQIRTSMLKYREEPSTHLPEDGLSQDVIMSRLKDWDKRDRQFWNEGKVSGAIYGKEMTDISAKAMRLFAPANPLHADIFPSIRQIEGEIIAMTLDLYRGGSTGVGTITTGGTESILMAMYGYRQWARQTKGIQYPEIIAATTVHAAFDKASEYFEMPLVKLEVDRKTFALDPKEVQRAITSRTCVIIGSSPCFPQGIVDPITELGQVAIRNKIGLHVDACLGGYVLPFIRMAGYEVPDNDFSVPGVTSISCDVHKYGCTPKGISTLLWKNQEMRKYQYFVAAEWTGGIYATPTLTGSKNGSISAAAWGIMLSYGKEGYTENARRIREAVDKVKEGINRLPKIFVQGNPLINVVAFGSDELSVYTIYDALCEKGWHVIAMQKPPSVHICVTTANCHRVEEYVSDIENAVREEIANPSKKAGGAVALYGVADRCPDERMIGDMCAWYLDCLYEA